jgi:hypothetical protein
MSLNQSAIKISIFFQYEEEYGVQNLDLYYDSPSQWARVYGKRSDLKSCAEKESVLQVSGAWGLGPYSQCFIFLKTYECAQ